MLLVLTGFSRADCPFINTIPSPTNQGYRFGKTSKSVFDIG